MFDHVPTQIKKIYVNSATGCWCSLLRNIRISAVIKLLSKVGIIYSMTNSRKYDNIHYGKLYKMHYLYILSYAK